MNGRQLVKEPGEGKPPGREHGPCPEGACVDREPRAGVPRSGQATQREQCMSE